MGVRTSRFFGRYVAIGDSSTEGLDDPDGQGGYRGWADRLAAQLAAHHPHGQVHYANLGIRGKRTLEIHDEQFERALAMEPDLVTIFSGTNDVISRRFDAAAFAATIATMHHAFIARGTTVLTFTLPDLAPVLPLARPLSARISRLNEAIRGVSRETGARVVDFARYPVAFDPRLWSPDRIHANSAGHARIAAALARALDLPGTDDSWRDHLPAPPSTSRRQRIRSEAAWFREHLMPWMWRHVQGKSIGDGVREKRPELTALLPANDTFTT